ncbi:MAG: radical SAM protein [Nitrospirota bacterium]
MSAVYLNIPINELKSRAKAALARLEKCDLCPNDCGVNRLEGQLGFCNAGATAKVASYNLHLGEEPAISGTRGSGTIFFSHCTMKCAYCQNWPISHKGNGIEYDAAGLAKVMLELQHRGAHNINLVTPTHYMPRILEALPIAIEGGFNIPIVYNTSGYEALSALRLLDGIVDIYLPDMRYSRDDFAKKYSKARMYTSYNRAAVKEMFRQAGLLRMNDDGIAEKGLIIRHLVLPEDISGTEDVLKFIAEELSPDIAISLMDQYFPTCNAADYPEINRKIMASEYEAAQDLMERHGLYEGWVQEHV